MEGMEDSKSCLFTWRGQKFIVEINPGAALKELGETLQKLTNVKADTLRLLVPVEKGSKLIYPFSDEHSCLRLDETSILKGKSIRMMGVLKDEVDEVIKNAKADLRIAGFDEEERRLKQRNVDGHYKSWKLPQGNYVFCDFRTLSIPGVELNPPASKAMELLHMIASDPGIVAIMNKHRWRVGILTELAPVGYVGVSPKCILGFNKNCGEEISLRLRTDDLKGFRKYQSIKKTLLHELAHMVFSEHDSKFYAFDKQLNDEASALDWTKARGHTLSGSSHSHNYEVEFEYGNESASQKLGGQDSFLPNARASSVNAAFQRLAQASNTPARSSEELISEPDPDEGESGNSMELESHVEAGENHINIEVDPDNIEIKGHMPASEQDTCKELIPENVRKSKGELGEKLTVVERALEVSGAEPLHLHTREVSGPESLEVPSNHNSAISVRDESDPNGAQTEGMQLDMSSSHATPEGMQIDSAMSMPEIDDPELQIIQDPVTVISNRIQSAIQTLKYEANPSEAGTVLQTLSKIIRNVAEHPDEMKFKKLRKANPTIQRNVARYKAALDILELIGFREDVSYDEFGRAETFLVFKRNDPGLLWLAKSSLESGIAEESRA